MKHVSEAPNVDFEYVIEFLRHDSLVSSALQGRPTPAGEERREVETNVSELHTAAHLNLVRIVAAILESNADLATQEDAQSRTPLWMAIEHGHPDVARLLLNHNHETTIAVTLVQQGNLEKLRLLFKAGYKINTCGTFDRTLLHYAVIHDKPDIAEELVQNGAEVNCEDRDGLTPLSLAVLKKKKPIFTHLLESSAGVKGIKASNLFDLCAEPETKVMMLVQDQFRKGALSFINTDELEAQISKVLKDEGKKRLW